MTEQEEIIRGNQARQLLAEPMLKEALEQIEAKLIEQLAQVDLSPERILKLQGVLAAKRTFEKYLKNVVDTGTMAAMTTEKKRKLRDIFRAA